ncbi:response regulator [Hyphobacterium sp. HN65]|uniref:Response regulator n=1 Tax=Hyphobacterium lacteum TaxID=3116575 RepID=A0ABU7LPZ7_9PROT|nr:response regulator [Hyphobacterium sp. HN65]MEE2525419.1 response regulator [Hyphobacterium sp. HN65]
MGAAAAIESFAHWSSTGDTWRDRPVLVLERGALMRRLLVAALKNAGAQTIITASDDAEARAIIEADLPGTVVTDWRADASNHREALSLVRSIRSSDNPAFRDVPIVLTSQFTSRTDVERARDAGVSEFLKKPLSTNHFLERVQSAALPRQFVRATRYSGPDRRRKPRSPIEPSFKRQRDVENGLVDSLQAARNACYALAVEVARDGCQHARRVSASLKRYLTAVDEFGPTENEIVEMHRAALVQLDDVRDEGAPVRLAVVQSLEEVVQMRLSRL